MKSFHIVGIGASSGGIEALQDFFKATPAGSNMAYVVILHLSPDHNSELTQVLQHSTLMPVLQVTANMPVEPNHVYVIPPGQHLEVRDSYLAVTADTGMAERRAPVDTFFRSLAESNDGRSIGVILSGTGANGSMGLKRIKECGGAVFVQNPREAAYNEMPRNAIATNLVDEVLNVTSIPPRIIAYRDALGSFHIPEEPNERGEEDQQALRRVLAELRLRTGHDFTSYKRPTLLRRIERRVHVRNLPGLSDYAEFLQQHPEEIHLLLKDLLISVTNFFRDGSPFSMLEAAVLPQLLKGKTAADQLRIWIAGCATGEEAYTIAMICSDLMLGMTETPRLQIFATDIDTAAIAVAREGLYSLNDVADVPPERLALYFTQEGERYRVRRELRETIVFANHNFLKEPPFSRIDLVSCRNVLIYLNKAAQERVFETFHFALTPGGYLLLGASESVDGANDLFSLYSREQHIWQSRPTRSRSLVVPDSLPRVELPVQAEKVVTQPRLTERISFGEIHQQLVELYAPPSLIVNEDFNIVHISEHAGRYLRFVGGEPTQHLLNLVHEEMRAELRSALYQAAQRKTEVSALGVKTRVGNHTQTLNIHVKPVPTGVRSVAHTFLLVIFEPAVVQADAAPYVVKTDDPVSHHLEEEVMRLKTQLRTSNEQHELTAEELKSGNEELQAMNEELRSATEELETSKEELQSINEELTTVNQELKVKVEVGSITSNNLRNIINSTDIGTIILDRSFRVVLFTPAARSVFNLIPADQTRPLSDITSHLRTDNLVAVAEKVLETLQAVEQEMETVDGRIYLTRLTPYRTEEDRIQGVVISFIDITGRKKTERALRAAEEWRRLLIQSAEDFAIFTLDLERQVNSWNVGAQNVFGYQDEEIIGRSGDILFVSEDREKGDPVKEATRALEEGRAENERWHIRKDGSRFWGSGLVHPLRDDSGTPIGFVKIMRDLTEQKAAAEAVRSSEAKYRTLFNSIDEAYSLIEIIYDQTGKPVDYRIVEHNPTAQNMAPALHPVWLATYARVAETGESIRFEHEAPSPGLYCRTFATRVGGEGSRLVTVVSENITERKRREANQGFIAHIAEDLIELSNTTDMMRRLGEKLGRFFGVKWTLFTEANREEETYTVYGWNDVGVDSLNGSYPMNNYFSEEQESRNNAGELTIVNDTHQAAAGTKPYTSAGIRSFIIAPVARNKKWHFQVTIIDNGVRQWRPDEIELLTELTARIWARLEKAKAEEALRLTNYRFEVAEEASRGFNYDWDLKTDGVVRSQSFTQVMGYHSNDIGRSMEDWIALVHPQDRAVFISIMYVPDRNQVDVDVVEAAYRVQHKAGHYCHMHDRARILRDDNGRPVRLIGQAVDVTARKEAEEGLRKSEERLRVTVENAVDYAIINLSTDGIIEGWSQGAERTFGWTEAEVLGQPGDIIFTPEDRAAGAPAQEMETAARDGAAPDERWHIRKDGNRFYMSGVMRRIMSGGVLHGFVKVARDLTGKQQAEEALRISEERYRIALGAAEMAAWDWNIVTDGVIWNDQHFYILGLQPDAEEKSTSFLLSFVHPDDQAVVANTLKKAVDRSGLFRAEFRIKRADNGEIRWMSALGRTVMRDAAGHATRMVGVMHDITSRKYIEQQKDEFIGVASHELRTPVTSIKTYTEVLQEIFEERGDQQNALLMQKLNAQVDRLTHLIYALLDTTRVTEGKLQLHKTDFDVDALIIDTVETMQRIAAKQLIVTELHAKTIVHADQERIRQVLINLIGNAIKYAPGTDRIIVQSATDGNVITICVQDFGIGIDELAQEQVFDRFFRGGEVSNVSGLGLGLYISATIVREHGGNISVQSRKGAGSLFCFTIPIAKE